MTIDPAAIGFDLDGVVADTMEAFIRLAREDYGLQVLPEQITRFQVEECLDIDAEIIFTIFHRLLNEPVENGMLPMAGAVSVLQDMAQRAPLTFVTARPNPEPIGAWLHETLGPEVAGAATLVAMGDHDAKGPYIKKLGLSHFVDDRYETCVQLQQDGIQAMVFEQPWNRGQHDLAVVRSWTDINRMINYQ